MPKSQAEVRMAHAVLGGKAKDKGMGMDYAREVVEKMRGKSMKSLPEHKKEKK
jgi:hypothetical protein